MSPEPARASARARCARRRSSPVAAWYTADRTSGWRTENDVVSPHEQPGVQGGLQGRLLHAEAGRCASQHVELAGVVRSSQQQHRLHRCGSRRLRSRNACSTWAVRWSCAGRDSEPRSWAAVQLAGQLQQGQRVAARLDDEPPGHLLGRRIAQVDVEEGSGRVRLEAGQ